MCKVSSLQTKQTPIMYVSGITIAFKSCTDVAFNCDGRKRFDELFY